VWAWAADELLREEEADSKDSIKEAVSLRLWRPEREGGEGGEGEIEEAEELAQRA
jgi:hypothetical protein